MFWKSVFTGLGKAFLHLPHCLCEVSQCSCSPARKPEVLLVAQSDRSQTVLPCLHVSTAQSVSSGALISRAVANGYFGAGGSASQAGLAGVFHGPTVSVQIRAGCGVGE